MMEADYNKKKTKARKEPNNVVLPALDYDPDSQKMRIMAGTPIIARKHNIPMGIANNETFEVKTIKKKQNVITVRDDEREIDIAVKDFKFMFYPAFAITTHKSQGMTFDYAYTIHEWKMMTVPMKYVALSRSTNLKNINISRAT
jgi:ATP-dependent exoDNAse (exonuclease V) alpha subunit